MEVNPNDTSVFENQPAQLEGVVRCGEQVEDVIGMKGQAKNIAQRSDTFLQLTNLYCRHF